jgi:hypothetical protein
MQHEPNALVARLAELDGATTSTTSTTTTLRQNSNPSKSQQQSNLHHPELLQQRHENRQDATHHLRNGQFPATPRSGALRAVVHAPAFSVLDHDSMHAPSPQRPRFRDIDTSAVLPEPLSSFADEPLPDIRTQAARLKRMMAADAMRQERPLDARRSDFTPSADALRYDELRSDDIARRSSTKQRVGDDNDAEFDEDVDASADDDERWRADESVAFVVADSEAAVLPYAPSPRFVMTATPAANSRLMRAAVPEQ